MDELGRSIVLGDNPGVGENNRILLLSRPEVLEAAPSVRYAGMNCTFKASPEPGFSQLLP